MNPDDMRVLQIVSSVLGVVAGVGLLGVGILWNLLQVSDVVPWFGTFFIVFGAVMLTSTLFGIAWRARQASQRRDS